MKALSVATYAALRKKVEEVLLLGQQKIQEAKVQTYWETGRFINEHLQANGARTAYGEKVIRRLADDVQLHYSVLQKCSQFAEKFPQFKIVSARRQLTWAHYRALITVPDEKKRLELIDRAVKEDWVSRDLEIEVRNLLWDERAKASDGKPPSLLPVPALGLFYTYKIIAPETVHSSSKQLLLDLGFSARLEMELFPGVHFSAGTILESKRRDEGEKRSPKHAPISRGYSIFKLVRSLKGEDALYTYKAFVRKFIDADTFHVEFRLGFGQLREETIRLRGIDCPEMETPEGKTAKRFVENALQSRDFITLKTVKSDKYDRYLADVYYVDAEGKEQYLNNRLLEKGHAVRVRE